MSLKIHSLSLRGRSVGEKGCGSMHGDPHLCSEISDLGKKGEVNVVLRDPSTPGCGSWM